MSESQSYTAFDMEQNPEQAAIRLNSYIDKVKQQAQTIREYESIIKQLQARIDKLINYCACLENEEDLDNKAMLLALAKKETPQQSLSAIKADAVEEAAKGFCKYTGDFIAQEDLLTYANQLRKSND